MKRSFKRIYRKHGIKYFAFPFIVLLILTALADQMLGNYMDNLDEASDLEVRLENNQHFLGLRDNIKRSHDELIAPFSPLQQQIFVNSEIAQSTNEMQAQVLQLLQSLYFDNIEFFDFSNSARGGVSRINMSAHFNGIPQQLPRLQAAIEQFPHIVAIDALEIKVIDDPQRGGQQLAVTARFVGLHMTPVVEIAPAKPLKNN